MSAIHPSAGSFNVAAGPNSTRAPLFEQWLEATRSLPGASAEEYLVVVSGIIYPTRSILNIDTGGGGWIDLDGIYSGPDGQLLLMRCADASRQVNVRSGMVNIWLYSTNLTLSHPSMCLMLQNRGGAWTEVFRSYGVNATAERNALGLSGVATWPAATDLQMYAGTEPGAAVSPLAARLLIDHAGRMIDAKGAATDLTAGDHLLMSRGGVLYKLNVLTLLGPSFSSYIITGEYGMGDSDSAVAAHGLGGLPKLVQGMMRCKTAELGCNVGEEHTLANLINDGVSRYVNYGADGANFWYHMTAGAGVPRMVRRDTGNIGNLNPSNWRFFMRMWR